MAFVVSIVIIGYGVFFYPFSPSESLATKKNLSFLNMTFFKVDSLLHLQFRKKPNIIIFHVFAVVSEVLQAALRRAVGLLLLRPDYIYTFP